MKIDDDLLVASYKHVDSMVEKADDTSGYGPKWYGWALRDAFIAGAKWQKKRRKPTTPPHKAKKKGRR